MRPGGLEPPTLGSEGRCSVPIELWALGGATGLEPAAPAATAQCSAFELRSPGAPGRTRTPSPRLRRPMLCPVELRALERVAGIEPASLAWKARALPLSYTRPKNHGLVGEGGFEPPTSASRTLRADQAALLSDPKSIIRDQVKGINILPPPRSTVRRTVSSSGISATICFQSAKVWTGWRSTSRITSPSCMPAQ